jgi:hypothetical protein
VFTYPLKQKSASEVIKALKEIFSMGRRPKVLRTDKGSEFKNKWVKAFLKKENVHAIYAENETKSSLAEWSIQNLENRMQRMFNQNHSYEFLEQLPAITKSINDTPSRPLGGNGLVRSERKECGRDTLLCVLGQTEKVKDEQTIKKETHVQIQNQRQSSHHAHQTCFSMRIRTEMDGRDLCGISAIFKSRDTSVQIERFCRRAHNRHVLRTGITEGRQKRRRNLESGENLKNPQKEGYRRGSCLVTPVARQI